MSSSNEALQRQLSSLETEMATLKGAGDYLIGVRIERSSAGGSASKAAKEDCKYARLRAGRGKRLPNGKKSLYIPVAMIAHYEAACDRGKQVQKLEQQIEGVRDRLWQLEQAQYQPLSTQSRKVRKVNNFRQPVMKRTLTVVAVDAPPPPITPAAILVLYRQHPNAPVHAIAAEIWQDNQKVVEVKAMHCMGMKGDRVSAYIKEILLSLSQSFGVTRFEDVVKEVPVHQCPIAHCPLKNG